MEIPETIEFTIPSQNVNITKGNGEDYYYKISATGPSSPYNDIDGFAMTLNKDYFKQSEDNSDSADSIKLNTNEENCILYPLSNKNLYYKLKEIRINNKPIVFDPHYNAIMSGNNYKINLNNTISRLTTQYFDIISTITGKNIDEISPVMKNKKSTSPEDIVNGINKILDEYMRRFFQKENDQPITVDELKLILSPEFKEAGDLTIYGRSFNMARVFWYYSDENAWKNATNEIIGDNTPLNDSRITINELKQTLSRKYKDTFLYSHIIAAYMYPIFKNKINNIPSEIDTKIDINEFIAKINLMFKSDYIVLNLYSDLREFLSMYESSYYVQDTNLFQYIFTLSDLPETLPNEHPEMKFIFKRV